MPLFTANDERLHLTEAMNAVSAAGVGWRIGPCEFFGATLLPGIVAPAVMDSGPH